MKTNTFTDKVILITGASSGIGEALAYGLSASGAKVILASRNLEALHRVQQKCETGNSNVRVLQLDLSDKAAIESKAEEAIQLWGRIDNLILNAGIASRDVAVNTTMEVNRTIMETNYFGNMGLARALLPHMIKRNTGHITVISSLSGKFGVPLLSSYAASKHALHGYFESLRAELRGTGIKISIIVPGFINTGITQKSLDGSGNVHGADLQVNRQGMSAEECAQKILKAIRRKKETALIGSEAYVTVYLNRISPSLLRKIIASHPMKKVRALGSFMKKIIGS